MPLHRSYSSLLAFLGRVYGARVQVLWMTLTVYFSTSAFFVCCLALFSESAVVSQSSCIRDRLETSLNDFLIQNL